MTSQPAAKEPPPDSAEAAEEDANYYRQILHELLEIGTRVARTVGAQADAPARADGKPAPDLTIPFDRIARAIRRTIVLARTLTEPLPARPARIAARKRIIREVEDVIQRNARDAEAKSLRAELDERLDGPDLDEEIGNRPVAEIIADICRDLGLAHAPGTHPWKRRTPADIAELCARAAMRSPAPAPAAADPPPVPAAAGARLLDGRAHFRGG